MFYAYRILSWVYLLVPVVAAGLALYRARRTGRARPVRVFLRACTTGAFLGGVAVVLYTAFNGTTLPAGQIALACYRGVAAICAVVGLNWLLGEAVARLLRLDPQSGEGGCCRGAAVIAIAIQAILLLVIGLPYLGSVAMISRPKRPSSGTPQTLLGVPYESVRFPASDGVSIDAWWIPAARTSATDGRGSVRWGENTVILCPGFGADKAAQLFLVRDLVSNGYNVLAIDLRAHGLSGGQFTAMGALEGRDALGAVRWLRANHSGECRRILGLGESLGAVALISAAADPGSDGQAIDAIAAYSPYDDLQTVIGDALQSRTIAPGRWTALHLMLPMASAQLGTNLSSFSPSHEVQALWPRPLLVLGNPKAQRIGRERSYELFRDAMQPKFGYFREDLDHDALLRDEDAALTVRIFFDGARSIL